ncbi:ABC transporter substrate-binding protein [Aeromicrobium wangtongii]|uniref:ABC transporter substrate-binding protein n=1 Tax=Aeromicrobium wangtongii TaxID=2969247 RepID=A0ABY5M807_9ACTN|nr:ABC transporter substrate-binding protein [Aeromicrobium wangtongii]MCD9198718.1 ABC transporter substrate-binding protein [Aeromicrobium wangtongii]UUP13236.1 ABC transporter substrate-binding protein [Aeromicrobium wangtongii]
MRRGTLRRLGIAATAVAILAAAGCSSNAGSDSSGSGSKTLTVAWTTTPSQLDPNVFTGLTWVYATDAFLATLVEYDTSVPEDQIVGVDDLKPSLAESWEVNEAGTQYTIKLRQGVKSPAGNEMTADDVVYSFERMYSNPASLQAGVLLATANVDVDKPVEKVDDYTIHYNLTAPSALAMSVLAYPIVGILDSTEVKKHATEDDKWAGAWLAQNSAGFGPYQVDTLKPDTELRLKRNPNYFDKTPYFENIVMKAVPDGSSRAQLLISGEADIASEPPIDQLKKIEDSTSANVSEQADSNRHNLSISTKNEILAKPEVRRALSHAIDREAIVGAIYQGYAAPALSPISSTLAADQPAMGEYDVALAKKELAAAGYADGFDMELSYATERPGPYAENLARLIQTDLKKVGVNVSLKAVPSAADFEEGVSKQKYESYLYSDRPSQPDAGFSLFLYSYSKSALNKSGFANAELDDLVIKALKLPTGDERTGVLASALDVLAEQEPIISLVEVPDLAGISAGLKGFRALPSGGTMFEELSRK